MFRHQMRCCAPDCPHRGPFCHAACTAYAMEVVKAKAEREARESRSRGDRNFNAVKFASTRRCMRIKEHGR